MPAPRIQVLAGVNGAGKSSVGGESFRAIGSEYYNPDEAARRFSDVNPVLSQTEANAAAWQLGRSLLERAINIRGEFSFETTLGASTIPRLLQQAATNGFDVYIWYAGLASPELHIKRVKARVARGGHDIPEADIRRRYQHSRLNLIHLLPSLAGLRVYDNSAEADPATGKTPVPKLVLHVERGKIKNPNDLARTPEWAKPVVAAALGKK